jgi:gamma-glutamyl:cysteine ligase YbdK (ATP-grasp superfamily)
MDDATQIKIRDLKLKIVKVERELNATLHNSNLAAALRTGHAGQLAKAAERDRVRLEAKLEELKAKLDSVTGTAPAVEEKATEIKAPVAEKKASAGLAQPESPLHGEKKAASAKAPAADKPKKAPSKKKAS